MRTFLKVGLWLVTGLIGGCAVLPPENTKPAFRLAEMQEADFANVFAAERAHNGGKQPELGLALSGGGTKAAAFAHGVLHGLNDSGLLDQVDAISTASGGGYAAFWYYSKRLEANRNNFQHQQIFNDCYPAWWSEGDDENLKRVDAVGQASARNAGTEVCKFPHHFTADKGDPYRWQAHLLRWPDVFGTSITQVTGERQEAPSRDTFKLAVTSLFEVLFGWTQLDSSLAQSYQQGIERTWGLNPKPRTRASTQMAESAIWTYTNDDRSNGLRVASSSIEWGDLQALYRQDPSMPLWILNTHEGRKTSTPDLRNLYELTPFTHGSPRHGMRNEAPPLPDMAWGVRASAAFADSQGLADQTQAGFLELASLFIPATRWGVSMEVSPGGQRVRLSDGGGAENLGLVSLVRRGLKDVIVVDSAQDARGLMDDLCWAKKALQIEGLSLTFKQLESFDKLCAVQFGEAKGPQQAYNTSAWMNPVVQGEVDWGNSARKTRVWLIKAAWNEAEIRDAYNAIALRGSDNCGSGVGQVNCLLLGFYGQSTKFRDKDDNYMIFPQHGTAAATANNSSYLFLGYRELGRMLASRLKRNTAGALEISGDRRCIQPVLDAGKRRPEVYSFGASRPQCKSLAKDGPAF